MFPQFGATAETLSKASTMVFRIGTDAHLYDDPEDVNIAPLLDSRFDSEKCEALKRLLALIAQGFDVSNFFPQVVKNVASQSFEVKRLVYLYLLHYAEKRPNEALLSINCFQKDLGDPNPLVRAWALRAMAGIRLHVISPIVLVAVGKCARDPSTYVRKCAANALPKLHDLRQEENFSAIEEIVGVLLSDHSPAVVGSAAAAFATVCSNNLFLIARNYKRLCETLPDVEEWGQIALIGILLRYVIARHGLVKQSIMFASHGGESNFDEKDMVDPYIGTGEDHFDEQIGIYASDVANMVSKCYIEGPDEYLSRTSINDKGLPGLGQACFACGESNEDVKILLQCTSPLLWSHNSAVVLAAASVHWIMAPIQDLKKVVKPLLFLLRSSNPSKYVILRNIQVFAKTMPSLFAPHFEDFFITSSDPYPIKSLKLEILSLISSKSSVWYIFQEFQEYIRNSDRRFAADTVAAIGLCAQRLTEEANTCMEGLLAVVRQESLGRDTADREPGLLVQSIMSIIAIIKLDPPSHEKVIIQLVRSLDSIRVPKARALIIWTVGEYNSTGKMIPRILTSVFQYLARCFTSESVETKLQILNATVKVLLCAGEDDILTLRRTLSYIIELAKCDINYDIRDRARLIEKLLSGHLGSQLLEEDMNSTSRDKDLLHILARHIFVSKIKLPVAESTNCRYYLPGSLSQIVLHAAPGYEPLPKLCSLHLDELSGFSDAAHGIDVSPEETTNSNSDEVEDPDALSASSDEEGTSRSSSQHPITDSYGSGSSSETESESEGANSDGPLIMLSDDMASKRKVSSDSLGDLMPHRALESWLNEQPEFRNQSLSHVGQNQRSSARISLGDLSGRVKPRTYSLLSPANGSGLKVDYSFSSEPSTFSQHLVCVEISFENLSKETISNITLVDEEIENDGDSTSSAAVSSESSSSRNYEPSLAPMEEIALLKPGQTMNRILQVRFHHHLLPRKLALWCNSKRVPVKLRPDIGYFIRELPMDVVAFSDKESRLTGMFECIRSCTFTDHIGELNNGVKDRSRTKDMFLVTCKSLAVKMLSNANVSLVSVDLPVAASCDDVTGLRLRFSSEIMQNAFPCLITVAVEGKCFEPLGLTVKVNCEETVFSLNLLNRIVNFLTDPV